MGKLVIEVRADGSFRVEMNGQVIGFIEDLTLALGTDAPPVVNITFVNPNKFIGEQRNHSVDMVDKYHALVAPHPYIEVFDRADTLPSGMPSIRAEEE